MHVLMILSALTIALLVRLGWSKPPSGQPQKRWQIALFSFLFPPLLFFTTAFAILCMGWQGQMLGVQTDALSYGCALLWLGVALFGCLRLARQGRRSLQQTRTYPQIDLDLGQPARLLNQPHLFCAQIGFWQPELVVSQGLLATLSPEQLSAVLAHEQAHYHYRDTFWFFWLGWLRRLTFWLPNTESLWQELLALRELRADRRAAKRVDALLLAEALLLVVSTPVAESESFCAAFSQPAPYNRLQERINALLDAPPLSSPSNRWFWSGWLLTLLPLVALPFHG